MITGDPQLLAAAAALRHDVFTIGQGVDPSIEADGQDPAALHSVVLAGDEVVATGRLVAEGGIARLGRIASRPDVRGRGHGVQVVRDLEGAAARSGLHRMRLHAQEAVVGFYERLGWSAVGPPDVEAGMVHRWMERDLLPGLRPVTDDDAVAVQELIGGCFAAYPGCVLDLDDLDAWMLAPGRRRPSLQVVPGADGGLDACAGQGELSDGGVELKSLYVAAAARRQGYGTALVGVIERAAREAGAERVTLWSDTRFTDAHGLYERLGYARLPQTRQLGDPSDTTEYAYEKRLGTAALSGPR